MNGSGMNRSGINIMRFADLHRWTGGMPGDISMIRVQKAVKRLKEGEAAGADGEYAKIIKYRLKCIEVLEEYTHFESSPDGGWCRTGGRK